MKNQLKKFIDEYHTANPNEVIVWLGWQAPSEHDIESIKADIASHYIGYDATEDVDVYLKCKSPKVETAISYVDGRDIFMILITDHGNNAPDILWEWGGGICLDELVEELGDLK